MEYMATVPDKYFQLCICDPPYGIFSTHGANYGGGGRTNFKKIGNKGGYKKDGKWIQKSIRDKMYNWDNAPDQKYFDELFRISNDKIIFGGNHFQLPITRCFIVWDKGECFYGRDFAECEYVWTSFNTPARIIKYNPHDAERIHPTQKPIALYKKIITNYAKHGDKIFDSHLGSGSIAIACHDLGFDLTGCELDTEYFEAMTKRIKNHTDQARLVYS
jgi:site-specific DNA-methyltransferase (adenine-specific)